MNKRVPAILGKKITRSRKGIRAQVGSGLWGRKRPESERKQQPHVVKETKQMESPFQRKEWR